MEIIVAAISSRLAVKNYKRTKRDLGTRFLARMAFFGSVREGIAKAVQRVSENQVFHEFPNCSQLEATDRVSIKLKDPQIHDMIQGWQADRKFNTITFIIRDENNHKQVIMEADLESGKGLTLKNNQGKPIMVIKLRSNDATSLGKLMHPAPATLFKVLSIPSPLGMSYSVQHSTDKTKFLNVEKVPVSIYQLGKSLGVGTNCVYWMKAVDGTVLGYVRPKLVLKSNTLMIKFMSTNRNSQTRATILGCGLLLFISECYPQLRAMLQESIRQAENS